MNCVVSWNVFKVSNEKEEGAKKYYIGYSISSTSCYRGIAIHSIFLTRLKGARFAANGDGQVVDQERERDSHVIKRVRESIH